MRLVPSIGTSDLAAPPSQLDIFSVEPAAGSLSVRRSSRAKRLSVRVLPHGHAEVVVPPRTRAADVSAFIAASQEWIERTRRRAIHGAPSADVSLPARIDLAAVGERWRVDYSPPRPKAALRVEPADDGGRLLVSANDVEARHLLRRWLAASARRILTPQVERIAGETGLRPAAVSIRRQRTRWGSCTTRRQVNLNCAALFLTEALVEYLIVHELCHLRHMNHSRKFWSLVGTIVPDVRAREAALAASWNAVPGWVFYGGSAS